MIGRLTGNCILSIVNTVLFFGIFFLPYFISPTWYLIFIIIFFVPRIAALVLGIVTLAMKKDESIRGLAIASGVLGIVDFLITTLFANMIVSLIAIFKMGKNIQNKEESTT